MAGIGYHYYIRRNGEIYKGFIQLYGDPKEVDYRFLLKSLS